ncbi:unnamed protein product [Protopolystoma xenopodis]|uniref:histone acetyltransferase n=1 Tax=Protopolystoma xenopodis TaxID=117903 RepID=A0A448WQ49_9PLAT|nr:unnamed protein product [Protopolystoma xenopodis]
MQLFLHIFRAIFFQMQQPTSEPSIKVDFNENIRTMNSSSDDHKRTLIQQQLLLLLHAHICKQQESLGIQLNCNVRHCAAMRTVLSHMSSCSQGKDCNFSHCASSKQIITHWRSCLSRECKVCEPLRRSSQQHAVKQNIISLQANSSVQTAIHPSNLPHNGAIPPNEDSQILNGYRSTQQSSSLACSSSSLSKSTLSGLDIPQSQRSAVSSENWKSTITNEQREAMVIRFVQQIFPAEDPTAYSDPRMKQFLDYVKKIEKDALISADTCDDYCKRLSSRYCTIKQELNEKRRQREGKAAAVSSTVKTNGESSSSTSPSKRPKLENNCIHSSSAISTHSPAASSMDKGHMSQYDSPIERVCKREEHSDKLNNSANIDARVPLTNGEAPGLITSTGSDSDEKPLPDTLPPKDESTPVVKIEPSSEKDRPLEMSESKPYDSIEDSAPDTLITKTESPDSASKSTPSRRKVWRSEELLQMFAPVLEKLCQERESEPFRMPVDWKALEIFDYPRIVTNPMDLSTICQKLEEKKYAEPWEVIDDFWLMFNNAWLYNKKTSKVYKICTRVSVI